MAREERREVIGSEEKKAGAAAAINEREQLLNKIREEWQRAILEQTDPQNIAEILKPLNNRDCEHVLGHVIEAELANGEEKLGDLDFIGRIRVLLEAARSREMRTAIFSALAASAIVRLHTDLNSTEYHLPRSVDKRTNDLIGKTLHRYEQYQKFVTFLLRFEEEDSSLIVSPKDVVGILEMRRLAKETHLRLTKNETRFRIAKKSELKDEDLSKISNKNEALQLNDLKSEMASEMVNSEDYQIKTIPQIASAKTGESQGKNYNQQNAWGQVTAAIAQLQQTVIVGFQKTESSIQGAASVTSTALTAIKSDTEETLSRAKDIQDQINDAKKLGLIPLALLLLTLVGGLIALTQSINKKLSPEKACDNTTDTSLSNSSSDTDLSIGGAAIAAFCGFLGLVDGLKRQFCPSKEWSELLCFFRRKGAASTNATPAVSLDGVTIDPISKVPGQA